MIPPSKGISVKMACVGAGSICNSIESRPIMSLACGRPSSGCSSTISSSNCFNGPRASLNLEIQLSYVGSLGDGSRECEL